MRETIYFYLAVCLIAVALKYLSVFVAKIFTRNPSLNHEEEHELGNYIKILILIILGLAMWYLANSGTYFNINQGNPSMSFRLIG